MNTETLRRYFQPAVLNILFVGESAPVSGEFFYRRSGMTVYMARAFEKAFGETFGSPERFLRFFRDQGCYLDDLSLVPVNGMVGAERDRALSMAVPALAERIRAANPRVVVVILKKIEGHVRDALALARVFVPIYVLPFPGQGHQREFVDGLLEILGRHLLATV